jgi:hypothetical protein
MSTTHGTAWLERTSGSTRHVASFIWKYWDAFQERRERRKLHTTMSDLSDKELMDIGYPHRFPRDLDFAMCFLQVDSSWYENYWLKERKPRPVGVVARNLPTIVCCLRLACDRVASVRRAVSAIVLRPKTHPET